MKHPAGIRSTRAHTARPQLVLVLTGIASIGLIVWDSWVAGTDPIGASVSVVLIVAVCIVYLLWERPDFYVACGIMAGAVVVNLLF